jgi:hypothetical protein
MRRALTAYGYDNDWAHRAPAAYQTAGLGAGGGSVVNTGVFIGDAKTDSHSAAPMEGAGALYTSAFVVLGGEDGLHGLVRTLDER